MHKRHCEEQQSCDVAIQKLQRQKIKLASCLFGSPRHFVARDDGMDANDKKEKKLINGFK
ncbi:hypothetical protein [Candidatus Tisiphia endosymbiont of Piscicola geometra]|uniref:hypothetical protein n=1 Tax=Candidatus Tisiphia endosymbiont of Piscicola geometra TaxID=3066273 RepID=UPI00312CC10C